VPRGKTMENGDTRVAPNGYHYTKVDGRQVLTHHLKMEEYLGRPLAQDERVHFKDNSAAGKQNFSPENLVLIVQGTTSLRRKIAQLTDRIDQLVKEKEYLESQLRSQSLQS
jgi:hypothetical protein